MVHVGSVILCPVQLRDWHSLWEKAQRRNSAEALNPGRRCRLKIPAPQLLDLDFLLLDQLLFRPCTSALESFLVLHLSTFWVSCRRTRWISSSTGFTPKVSGHSRRCLGETWFQGSLASLISYFAFIKHDFAKCARDDCLPAFLRLLTTGRQRT